MMSQDGTLQNVPPGKRVLLLPHCLRPSHSCPGRPSKEGFQCPEDCQEDCAIRRLKEEAHKLGYKAVCIAPGGALALKLVRKHAPQAVVAIACHKELAEGAEAVSELDGPTPQVATLPLREDGCVDTEVDLDAALELLRQGLDED
ncbi:MAG: DUF116 domain-containing protein [Candidatus Bipolaricaulota bacterium]